MLEPNEHFMYVNATVPVFIMIAPAVTILVVTQGGKQKPYNHIHFSIKE